MSNAALLKIYNTVFITLLFYNILTSVERFWCSAKNYGQIEKIFKLQKRAARTILNVKTTQISFVDTYRVFQWMTIQETV